MRGSGSIWALELMLEVTDYEVKLEGVPLGPLGGGVGALMVMESISEMIHSAGGIE
jgi:hypothetical protein